MSAYEFMGEHPILTLLLLCVAAHYSFRCWNRLLRHLNIRKAGWPPAHLDADGDFKPEPEQEGAQ